MIKYWKINRKYHCFLANAKTTFDSSERIRLQSELASPREKLRLFGTDAALFLAARLPYPAMVLLSIHISTPMDNRISYTLV